MSGRASKAKPRRKARAVVLASELAPLRRYDAACKAIAAARNVDEVLQIHDKALVLRLLARQANNRSLEIDAAEIRVRAVRRLGEIIVLQKKTIGLAPGGKPYQSKAFTGSKAEPVKPTLAAAGIDRKLSASSQKIAAVPVKRFEASIKDWRTRTERDGGRVVMSLADDGALLVGDKTDIKKSKRAARERELGAQQMALPDRKFGVILADPEWRFEPYSRESGMDRSPDNHYPTSELQEIIDRPVEKIAADDCVLFLWATSPMLPAALQVMEAWGFSYKTHIVWKKKRAGQARGTGYWFTGEHELLLVGTCGNIPAPAPGTQFGSVQEAPIGGHSQKPEWQYHLIEKYFPTLPKIELNARGPARPGWEAWGNEARPAKVAA